MQAIQDVIWFLLLYGAFFLSFWLLGHALRLAIVVPMFLVVELCHRLFAPPDPDRMPRYRPLPDSSSSSSGRVLRMPALIRNVLS